MTIDPNNLTLFAVVIAFAAGLVSFLSPCCLPLVPAYISYLGAGVVTAGPGSMALVSRRSTFLNAVFFVLGFSLVFILLGVTVGLIGFAFQDAVTGLLRAGAALLLVFGLRVAQVRLSLARWLLVALAAGVFTYLIDARLALPRLLDSLMVILIVVSAADLELPYRLPLGMAAGALNVFASPIGGRVVAGQSVEPIQVLALILETVAIILIVVFVSHTDLFYMEKRFEMEHTAKRRGPWTSMLMGAIFGAGWTPCVGPNLSIILSLGLVSQTVGLAAVLLAVYSLGLGVPFLLVGLAFGYFAGLLQRMKRHMGTITAVNGALLVLMGILLLSGRLAMLAQFGTFFNL